MAEGNSITTECTESEDTETQENPELEILENCGSCTEESDLEGEHNQYQGFLFLPDCLSYMGLLEDNRTIKVLKYLTLIIVHFHCIQIANEVFYCRLKNVECENDFARHFASLLRVATTTYFTNSLAFRPTFRAKITQVVKFSLKKPIHCPNIVFLVIMVSLFACLANVSFQIHLVFYDLKHHDLISFIKHSMYGSLIMLNDLKVAQITMTVILLADGFVEALAILYQGLLTYLIVCELVQNEETKDWFESYRCGCLAGKRKVETLYKELRLMIKNCDETLVLVLRMNFWLFQLHIVVNVLLWFIIITQMPIFVYWHIIIQLLMPVIASSFWVYSLISIAKSKATLVEQLGFVSPYMDHVPRSLMHIRSYFLVKFDSKIFTAAMIDMGLFFSGWGIFFIFFHMRFPNHLHFDEITTNDLISFFNWSEKA